MSVPITFTVSISVSLSFADVCLEISTEKAKQKCRPMFTSQHQNKG